MTGQETNEAVARRLGWTISKTFPGEGSKYPNKLGTLAGVFIERIPNYCNDISAAWEIVEHVQSKGLCWELRGFGEEFSIGIGDSHQKLVFENAATATMAICLAFLKLKESGKRFTEPIP